MKTVQMLASPPGSLLGKLKNGEGGGGGGGGVLVSFSRVNITGTD